MESINPVNWWHGMEGGKIAEQRPPPPGANDPYPNLASVPARPAPPDKEAMQKLTDALVADRSNAQYTNQATPLPDPSSPSASPGLFGVGTLPPPPPNPGQGGVPGGGQAGGQGGASATMQAVTAPPPPRTPPAAASASSAPASAPAAAPATPVQSASLDAASPPPAQGGAPMPALPVREPARAAVAPTPLREANRPGPPPSIPAPAAAIPVAFAPGSAALPPDAADTAKRIAASRGTAVVAVTGYGEAESSNPQAQTAAISLALSRAQAVENALNGAGIPRSDIRIAAEAGGRGASVRLLQ
jgi:outer membrane protein OmpA-like peptidoglycan-associated protein